MPASSPSSAVCSHWAETTTIADAKQEFVAIMEGMDERYCGLGAPSGRLKNPLDQWIDAHNLASSPRRVALFAWREDTDPARDDNQKWRSRLVLAVTFQKPTGHSDPPRRIVVEMLGINRELHPEPSPSEIQGFGRLIRDHVIDFGSGQPDLETPSGQLAAARQSVVVTAFRPKSMSWPPAMQLHDFVLTYPGTRILEERDCGDSIYWRFEWTKV